MADIKVQQEGRVLVLTVDRPRARNALAGSTMQELDAHLADLADRADIHCAVIIGAGERAFIAGGDLKELESQRDEAFARQMAEAMRASLDARVSIARARCRMRRH